MLSDGGLVDLPSVNTNATTPDVLSNTNTTQPSSSVGCPSVSPVVHIQVSSANVCSQSLPSNSVSTPNSSSISTPGPPNTSICLSSNHNEQDDPIDTPTGMATKMAMFKIIVLRTYRRVLL